MARYSSPSMSAPGRGPFTSDQLKEGGRYELTRGHPVYVSPAGGRHGREHIVGALSIATDPAASEVGIDVGYSPDGETVRAPDLSVGNVPNRPGWVDGAPRLAIEYADRGTDESDLQAKIGELIAAGTEWVWVVRLTGPQRVDVHPSDGDAFTVPTGGMLDAPGALSQPLPVDALFSLDRANEIALRNLLARYGNTIVSEAREEGREAGRVEGLRLAVVHMCQRLGIAIDEHRLAQLGDADRPALEALYNVLIDTRAWP
jgi:Uma2 family endonuclease